MARKSGLVKSLHKGQEGPGMGQNTPQGGATLNPALKTEASRLPAGVDAGWDLPGVICRSCRREVWRARDGSCLPCWEREHEIELRLPPGMDLSCGPVVMEIAQRRRE